MLRNLFYVFYHLETVDVRIEINGLAIDMLQYANDIVIVAE